MDILNWLYLKKQKLVKTTFNNTQTDLLIIGADVSFNERDDKYLSYAITIDDFIAQLPTSGIVLTTVGTSGPATLTGNILNIPDYTTGGGSGTVTSVGIVLGTSGNDVNVSNTPITSSGDIALNIPIASATNTGKLSSTDWTIFNGKQNALGYTPANKAGDTFTGPISATNLSGTNTGDETQSTIKTKLGAASTSQDGYLTSTDWNTFNNKVNSTRSISTTAPLSGGGDLSANRTLSISQASAISDGYLSGTDWSTFNSKGNGTVTNVDLSMPPAFSVSNSPIISSGTIAVTGAGTVSQYVRGDGTLANFPNSTGGGASVNYYLNGSVSQGTFGGDTYYQMSKTPILGAGTNFTRTNGSGDGYIASFITDAGDPSFLNIPGGNWNLEFYFQSSASGGSPQFYGEIYKVSATNVFTLVASGSVNPESITNGTTVDQYFTSIPVSQTSLLVTDRLAIRIYVITGGRTITLHTENGNLCQVLTTFTTGLTALNGLTSQVQYFATGTSGTDFNISSATDTHTFNLPTASALNRGALSSTDWSTFNNKVGGSGTTNYITKFTASGTVGNSQIQDNGSTVSLGEALDFTTKFNVYTLGTIQFAGKFENVADDGTGAGVPYPVYGVDGIASNLNQTAIGGRFIATDGNFNYSLRLIDGTELVAGRFLKNMTTSGDANWATLSVADTGLTLTTTGASGAATLVGNTLNIPQYAAGNAVAFSPQDVSAADTAPTAASTQYYYQTISTVTGTISKVKLWGFSGTDLVRFGIYRGILGGSMTLIGQGSATCVIGPNEISLTAEIGQTLDLVVGENLVVGYYADGISWRTIYDVGISDAAFGITNTANITTMPATPTGTATGIRFACTLYS
jgi:hypothetical protein